MSQHDDKPPETDQNKEEEEPAHSLLSFLNPLGLVFINSSLQRMHSRHTNLSSGENSQSKNDATSPPQAKQVTSSSTTTNNKKASVSDFDEGGEDDDIGINISSVAAVGVAGVPDGGYGWVVVFASFMCNVLVDGIANSFGLFLPKYVESFDVGAGAVAWAASLLVGTMLLIGPITSALTNKFGCRAVCVAGSIVAAAGFALSSLANNLGVLIFTYGIIGGIGCGLIYLPAVVCVGYYFERKRAFATGVAVCGSGVGTLVFAQIAEALLKVLSWKQVNLIYAGLVLMCGGFGMLMKPLVVQVQLENVYDEDDEEEDDLDDPKFIKSKSTQECDSGYFMVQLPDGRMERRLKVPLTGATDPEKAASSSDGGTPHTPTTSIHSQEIPNTVSASGRRHSSLLKFNYSKTRTNSLFSYMGRTYSFRAVPIGSEKASPSRSNLRNSKMSLASSSKQKFSVISGSQSDFPEDPGVIRQEDLFGLNRPESRHIIRPMSRKDVFYSGSIHNLPEYQNRKSITAYRQSVINVEPDGRGDEPPSPDKEPSLFAAHRRRFCPCFHLHPSDAFKTALSQMTDFSLLKNPIFIFIVVANVFGFLGFYVPTVFIVPAAKAMKVRTTEASSLISIMGASNTIGRITTGILSDLPKMNSLVMYNCCLFFSGVVISCVPWCTSYADFIGIAIFFGLFISGFISLTSIILVKLLGLEKLTNAFGLLILFWGTASILGVPLAGALFDTFGSYDIPFRVAGGFFVAAALVGAMIPIVVKFGQPKHVLQAQKDAYYRVGYLEEEGNGEAGDNGTATTTTSPGGGGIGGTPVSGVLPI